MKKLKSFFISVVVVVVGGGLGLGAGLGIAGEFSEYSEYEVGHVYEDGCIDLRNTDIGKNKFMCEVPFE